MPGVSPVRRTVSMMLNEAARRLADLALAAFDGDEARFYSKLSSGRIVYPTRAHTEGLVRSALTPHEEWPRRYYGKTAAYPEGIDLLELFEAAADDVIADDGDDAEALAALVECYDRIMADDPAWVGAPEQMDRAVFVLASFDPESLWCRGVMSALPMHPMTPGSEGWEEAQATGGPHESVANPFTRKR